jgi:solute carrier family 25 (mitochondrial citrate transporter), member 1
LAISNVLKSAVRFLSFEMARDHLDKISGSTPARRSPWVNVCSGLTAGVIESLFVVTPGETLKTRLVQEAATGRAKGTVEMATQIVRNDGLAAMWRGAGPVVCKQATNSAVRFSTFATLQEKLYATYPQAKGNIAGTLILGGLSGIVTV